MAVEAHYFPLLIITYKVSVNIGPAYYLKLIDKKSLFIWYDNFIGFLRVVFYYYIYP